MNKVIISGRLGKDPELFAMPSGQNKVEISVANNTWTKNGARTIWIQARAIGKRADAIAANLRKGSRVWLEGSWQCDEWEDKATHQRRRMDYLFISSAEWDARGGEAQAADMSRDTSHGGDDDAY